MNNVLTKIFTFIFNPFIFFSGRFTQTKTVGFFNKYQQAIFLLALVITGLIVLFYYYL